MNFIKENTTTEEVMSTLTFLEKLTDSNPRRAASIAAVVLSAFSKDEATALEIVSDVFAIVNDEV